MDIFSDLDEQALTELGHLFKERIYDQKEVIFEEGSIGNSMMVIASGEVRISQIPDPKTEEALVILKKGDVFGEMGLLDDLPRSATPIAHTNVITLEISRDDFLNYVLKNCENGVKILLKLSRTLSLRLRETDAKLKAFVSLSQWL
ncbi:MAG: cyclic nucleotide-binding domain-containing protein [Candidatus Aminicenantes bacterium]|nr:cyclic nucleotide-binding domain-containing protein [Candidatus Aminicenantes bacterium]NIN45114.1 cyclic nucleotide-binding domain-containing protein [Candidatus Aminicenantes bacterium]NIN87931.1 cyclic nucleotide-binding domain-containing protein [Candidatus Aminicenantes bacterium]NIR08761.1 cyclic nucleotide-binding domain-containing protein [Candidatus Aminicenantes bacterium]NIT26219.1 cyclic nucleotide-binding domain-containing protein [Candidatus Aminicenantes bacterium]